MREGNELEVVAIVPMRHSSERVPGKNYRNFAGIPLYRHIVSTLLACPEISGVVIDTDSDVIRDDVTNVFPEVALHQRPPHLRSDTTPMNDVLLNTVTNIDADFYVQTHSTNPLLKSATISAAMNSFLKQQHTFDSLFSVTRLQTRLWDLKTRPINHDPQVLLRTQDLEPVFEENSCLYIFSRESLEKQGNRIGSRPMMFEIERLEAQDIDEEIDFILAELLSIHSNSK